ncbi:MAG: RNA polymerase factor sigma-54 [Cocleimonas sp.]|nr:RNA polymerase factor sigma-54 [Cocleimonas sp.]
MTPQLQQAIRLLQLSSVELQQEIQEVLETNPLLERTDDDSSEPVVETEQSNKKTEINDSPAPDSSTESIPEDMSIDADWDDIYDPAWKVSNGSESSASDFIETMHSAPQGLHDNLLWQVEMSNLSLQDKEIAKLIIDYIDDDGYLTESLEQIHDSLEDLLFIEFDEVEAILTYVQNLGPTGVAARSLSECLLLQLLSDHTDHPLYKKAFRLLDKNLDLLEKRDYTGIKRTLRLTTSALEELMQLIRSLEPKPGKAFSTTTADYITPDIYVKKVNGQWKISLNGETQPKLQVNDYYAEMLNINTSTNTKNNMNTTSSALGGEATSYIKDNLQQARWFIKSLENRNSTIVNVAHAIVGRQLAFLQYGDEAMKPMVLKDLADQLGLHESTISRVTTRKYMHTPRGVYEFKHFFSSHVSTDTGGECSATAIRAMIKKLINDEDPAKPLSDNKLTNLLKQRGINVARRTVAKYREALAIPSSHDRKVFA